MVMGGERKEDEEEEEGRKKEKKLCKKNIRGIIFGVLYNF